MMQKPQESYTRNRDHPFFDGILKRSTSSMSGPEQKRSPIRKINSLPSSSQNDDDTESYPSTLDLSAIYAEKSFIDSSVNDHPTVHKLTVAPSFSFPNILLDCEVPVLPKSTVERTYIVNKRKPSSSGAVSIPLPQSAASFYTGFSPQVEVVESHESVRRLNWYLKARKIDVKAGVPAKYLHAVMGQAVTTVSCVASTIMYAFYLNETLPRSNHFCTVPIINMKREDLKSHGEIRWLLDSCHIDQSSLIFVDEIDLAYYHEYGGLKLVLMNFHKVAPHQEAFKDSLVEIFNCKVNEAFLCTEYPWVKTITTREDLSCCTVIANKFLELSPELLGGQGFSRLLLGAILLDTGNLKNSQCTPRDKYTSTLLINGAGRYGCNGLYQILKYKMYDISQLKVGDILRKDFKKWKRGGGKFDHTAGTNSKLAISQIGMSSIGISVTQLLSHDDTAIEDIVLFQQSEKLRLLMVVSGYYDQEKNFKREILVSSETPDLMRNLLHFFNANASQLPLKVLNLPGLREELRAFEIENKVTSRKTIECLLEEFGGASKR